MKSAENLLILKKNATVQRPLREKIDMAENENNIDHSLLTGLVHLSLQ